MTEPPIVPFPTSPYCQVRARVASIWADGPDDGTHPDWRPAVGEKVSLIPSIGSLLLAYDVGGTDPIIVTVERVECVVGSDGFLTKSDGRPVYIAPTDDPLLSATGWTWTAIIKGKPVVFSAPTGGVVDLALFVATPAVNAVEYVSVVQVVADYIAAHPPDVSAADLAAHVADTAGVHGIADTAALVVTTDPRLSDARPPVAHGHTLAEVTDAETRVAMVPAERAKLGGIAAGATANATDEALRDRATHTGVQPAESLSDLAETVQDIVAAFVVAGPGVTVSHDDDGNRFSIAADAGSITDPEIVRDVIGAALWAGAGVQITVSDEGDTLTIASTAVLPTRQVTAGDGLMGGGDLSTDRAFAVAFGTTPGTVAEGDHGHNLAGLSAPGALAGRVLTADGTGGAGWSPVPVTDLSAYATKDELAAAVGDVEAALGVILS